MTGIIFSIRMTKTESPSSWSLFSSVCLFMLRNSLTFKLQFSFTLLIILLQQPITLINAFSNIRADIFVRLVQHNFEFNFFFAVEKASVYFIACFGQKNEIQTKIDLTLWNFCVQNFILIIFSARLLINFITNLINSNS